MAAERTEIYHLEGRSFQKTARSDLFAKVFTILSLTGCDERFLLFNYEIILFRQIHHINHSSQDTRAENQFLQQCSEKVFKTILN